MRPSLTFNIGRVWSRYVHACLSVKRFTSSSRGKILDDFTDLKVSGYFTRNLDRRGVDPRLFGLEIPDAVRNNLKYIAVVMSDHFVFRYDESKGPEIEDVQKARDGCWDHLRPPEDAVKIHYGVLPERVRKGRRIACCALPNVFTKTEWAFIDRMAAESAKGSEARFSLDEGLVLHGLAAREP